jgi:hypothetical protein
MSWDGFKKEKAGTKKLDLGSVLGAIFIAVINALVLASAVVGATSAGTGGSQ